MGVALPLLEEKDRKEKHLKDFGGLGHGVTEMGDFGHYCPLQDVNPLVLMEELETLFVDQPMFRIGH